MSTTTAVPQTVTPVLRQRMTLAEFNALPEDPERERMLLNGELWEWPMTKRNRRHARVEARVSQLLSNWRDRFARGQFDVFSGEVGCDLPDSESGLGIDVAIFSSETLQEQDPESPYIDGVPVLAVEILSPSDTAELLDSKIQNYLDAGVKFVWIVNTVLQTVTVHSPGMPSLKLRLDDELTGDPELPGLVIPVRAIFE